MNQKIASQNNKLIGKLWLALLGILVLTGVGLYIRQITLGLITTGMNNAASWGLYIITFALLVGLSAGGLIVSSTAYVLKLERLEKMAPVGVIAAVACVVGAIGAIFVDVGNPINIYRILLGGNFTSPITWDFIILPIYLVLGLVELYIMYSAKWKIKPAQVRQKALLTAAWVGLPVAILVHSVTAWIFGLQLGRPFWNTALMAPIFISSAIVSGVGLLLIVAYVGQRFKLAIPGLDKENCAFLTRLLAVFIMLDFFFLFCELFTVNYGGGGESAISDMLLSGTFAPLFWAEVAFGVITPLILLTWKKTRSTGALQALAGVLVMLGVFAKRINIILPSFLHLGVPDTPGVSTGRYIPSAEPFNAAAESSFAIHIHYMPTASEIMITISILSLVALLITVGVRWIVSVNTADAVPLSRQTQKPSPDYTDPILTGKGVGV